ncbi:hypothetical protein ABWH96_12645 [Marivirga tractuosa]|uniref:glycosyltransferase n=1 Tax=Marivirga tractuosa TaxID=1006 RepID=UPI0035D138AB
MNILLIGDFSGFGRNLKAGLQELGHELTIAVSSVGWKKFQYDLKLSPKKRNVLTDRIHPYSLLDKLCGYDIVLLIDPLVFYKNYFPRKDFYKRIFKNNGASFLIGATMDPFFWRHSNEYMRYTPYNDMLKHDWNPFLQFKLSDKAYDFNRFVAESVDGIIPVMYDYEGSYKMLFPDKTKTIPLPFHVGNSNNITQTINDKLTFFHGISRFGFKGSEYIEKAFHHIQMKYSDKVELICSRKLPFNEYIEILNKSNVVIDQTNSYSYGMNALYSLNSGKTVMSGAENEALDSLNSSGCPIINIIPNVDQIISEMEAIIENPKLLNKNSERSRMYLKNYHDSVIIADRYINYFKTKLS